MNPSLSQLLSCFSTWLGSLRLGFSLEILRDCWPWEEAWLSFGTSSGTTMRSFLPRMEDEGSPSCTRRQTTWLMQFVTRSASTILPASPQWCCRTRRARTGTTQGPGTRVSGSHAVSSSGGFPSRQLDTPSSPLSHPPQPLPYSPACSTTHFPFLLIATPTSLPQLLGWLSTDATWWQSCLARPKSSPPSLPT